MSGDINHSSESFESSTGLGRVRETAFYIGIIKGNKDPHRMGRLAVYIPELGGSPSDPDTWYTVSYASPFAGATNIENNQESGEAAKKQDGTQKSYGWWAVPPDVNNEVVVCFANGDTSKGYWFGCLYQQFMNHMVPAMGLNRSTDDAVNEQNLPPVCEYNKRDKDNESTFWDPKRPIFEPLYNGLRSQGLFSDPERGPATTGARRESPSKVFGFISPRGNNYHIDDDEQNEFIRLRTRSGVQILLHETTGYIYMNSKLGNSWLEISDEGIDMYAKKTISMRAEEGINIHGDMHVSKHGGGAVHSHGGGGSVSNGAHTAMSSGVTYHQTTGVHTVKAKTHDQYADQQERKGNTLSDSRKNEGGNQQGSGQGGGSNPGQKPKVRVTLGENSNAGSNTTPPTQNDANSQPNQQPDAANRGGASQTSANKPLAFGDSIANGVAGAAGLDGQTKVGANPATVLGYLQAQDPASLRGQNVILSSGISNPGGGGIATVQQQIDLLKNAGANVTILGAGPNALGGAADGQIQQLAQQNGINYQPIGQTASDGIHPRSYGNLVQGLKIK